MIADLIAIKTPWTAEDFERTGTTPEEAVAYILKECPEVAVPLAALIKVMLKEQEVKQNAAN